MRVLYVTARAPCGKAEAFIIPEILQLVRQGLEVAIVPIRPGRQFFHAIDDSILRKITIRTSLLSFSVLVASVLALCERPRQTLGALAVIVRQSGSLGKLVKNILVMPKGLFIGRLAVARRAHHIHAHWGSTPSTAAYVAARYASVPFSFTVHRWDIPEENLLPEKVGLATFVRAISRQSANDLRKRVPENCWCKTRVIHMGVDVPATVVPQGPHIPICLASVGSLTPIKGHSVLIDACERLRAKGLSFRCDIWGEGPLHRALLRQIQVRALVGFVALRGVIAHGRLLEMYAAGDVDVLVHPSVEVGPYQREGIPVVLIEAMAAGVPVVSTTTGGISELVEDSGVLVPGGDPIALAEALQRVAADSALRKRMGMAGRRIVQRAFSLPAICAELIVLMGKMEVERKK